MLTSTQKEAEKTIDKWIEEVAHAALFEAAKEQGNEMLLQFQISGVQDATAEEDGIAVGISAVCDRRDATAEEVAIALGVGPVPPVAAVSSHRDATAEEVAIAVGVGPVSPTNSAPRRNINFSSPITVQSQISVVIMGYL